MKRFDPLSFCAGIGTGVLVLLVVFGASRALHAGSTQQRPAWQQNAAAGRFQGGAGNTARMAERFGMTEDELQAELDAGKTVQEIAAEHGVDMPVGGRGPRGGSGSVASRPAGSGVTASSSAPAR